MFKRIVLPLLGLAAPAAKAQGCQLFSSGGGTTEYVRFGSSDFLSGNIQIWSDSNCQNYIGVKRDSNGFAFASNRDAAYAICDRINSLPIDTVERTDNPNLWRCKLGAGNTSNDGSSESISYEVTIVGSFGPTVPGESDEEIIAVCQSAYPSSNSFRRFGDSVIHCLYSREVRVARGGRASGGTRASRPFCPADVNLPLDGLRLHAVDGMESGIIFQRRNHCAVGVQEVIDMGFLDAVDVWSNIGSGFSVCFPQPGRIVFLDAATSPRVILFPEVRHEDLHTCASLTTAGLLVLVEAADDTSAESSTPTRRPGTDDSIDDAIALEDCTVTPRVNLRLRESPWGAILAVIPRDSEVPAMARTENWFNLTYEETEGWSAAWLVNAAGDCDWSE